MISVEISVFHGCETAWNIRNRSGMGGYYSGPNRGPSACAIYWRDPDSLSPSLFETRVGVWFFLRPLTRGGLQTR